MGQKLYTVWWDNGYTWDDHSRELVGVFSTLRRAYTAGQVFKSQLVGRSDLARAGFFDVFEITVNKAGSEVLVKLEDHTEYARERQAQAYR